MDTRFLRFFVVLFICAAIGVSPMMAQQPPVPAVQPDETAPVVGNEAEALMQESAPATGNAAPETVDVAPPTTPTADTTLPPVDKPVLPSSNSMTPNSNGANKANRNQAKSEPDSKMNAEKPGEDKSGADLVPEGQELVNIDFPEPTEIKDIARAVFLWTGKNVIIGKDVAGKVQMISPRKVTKVEAYQMFLSALNTLGFTTIETGKVIKIVSLPTAVKSNLKTLYGTSWTPATDELITQIVPLKYVNAREIQTTLSRLVSANAMIPYAPTNTLIISDSGYKVRRILDIIELLDVQTQQPKVSIVPIRYGDAKAIAGMLENIFKGSKAGREVNSYRIFTDERTNSVVIFGPPRTIEDVKVLVRQFDVQTDDPARQASIHVRPLDYADAKKLAATLSALAQGGNKGAARRPPIAAPSKPGVPGADAGGADVAVLDNDMKITADESSNSLLITGSRVAYESLNNIIRKLDTRRSQVFIEAEILDLNISGNFRFGTSIFAGAKGNNTNTAITWQAKDISPLIVSQVTKPTDEAGIGAAAKPFAEDLNIGILSGAKVNVPGIGEISPGALIKMLKSDSYTRVLSSPHLLTSNNEAAKFTVGEKLFFKSGTEIAANGATAQSQVKSEDVDLTLEIKPNISHSNYVTMKMDLDANSGNIRPDGLPQVVKRKTSQIVTVKNGQTIVVSGLVRTAEFESYQKIPLLGDIPILGWLFRNSSKQRERTNLVVFLTPYIVHGANDLSAIYTKKVSERDEILGRIYGSDFKESEFYKSLPQQEDGAYRADAYDVIDEKRRADRDKETMRDLGYNRQDVESISEGRESSSAVTPEGEQKSESQDIVLPSASSGGGDDGVSVGGGSSGGGDDITPLPAGDLPSLPDAPIEPEG